MVVHSYYLRDGRIRREAEALVEAGHNVDVICLRDRAEARRQEHNRVNIYRLPVMRKRGSKLRYLFEYGAFLLLASIQVLILHPSKHYKILHISTLPDFLVFAGLAPRWLGVKIILDVHDLMPETFLTKRMGETDSAWMRLILWVEKISLRFPDRLVTIHEPYANLISNRVGRPLSEITSLMNLADENIFKRVDAPEGERQSGRFVMLYSGTVAKRYGVDTAIRAVPLLKERIPGFKFVILGEGEHKPEFERLAQELGVSDCIEFHPPVPIEEVPSVMRKADVGIAPHVNDVAFRWSFPQKVHEYLNMGLPVVASRTEVLEYYYKDVLYYIKPGNAESLAEAICEVFHKPELARLKTNQARTILENHRWSAEKGKLISLVAELTR